MRVRLCVDRVSIHSGMCLSHVTWGQETEARLSFNFTIEIL